MNINEIYNPENYPNSFFFADISTCTMNPDTRLIRIENPVRRKEHFLKIKTRRFWRQIFQKMFSSFFARKCLLHNFLSRNHMNLAIAPISSR